MIVQATFAALRQTASAPLRRILLRSLGLTILLLLGIWVALTNGIGWVLKAYPVTAAYPAVDAVVVFLAGAGLLIALAYLLPVVSALVAGFFLDDAAAVVERTDFPADPPGRPLPTGSAILYGLRFAGLALLVNLAALALFFIPGVNIAVFFLANAYLLSREYFEMAAARFRPIPDAARMRRAHRPAVLGAGAVMAGLMLVPILNLVTPIFGIALMVHMHKRIAGREARAL